MRRQVLCSVVAAVLVLNVCGCAGLARKFRRENKRAAEQKESMVVVPEQYPLQSLDRSARYEQVFLFWKSWHEELIAALAGVPNRKKVREALAESVKNLEQMQVLLAPQQQESLGAVIAGLHALGSAFDRDTYAQQLPAHRDRAQNLYLTVLRSFSFSDVKDSLQ